jgi:hypothetical protein
MKKKLPLIILETLEKYIELKDVQFEVIKPEDFLLKIIDKDKTSDFYFNIESCKIDIGGLKLLCDWKPANKESISNSKKWISDKQLDGCFKNWIDLLEKYESVESFFDDPILKSFTEDYFSEYQILEEDSHIKPFSPKKILLLDECLESIVNKLDNYQTEENKDQFQNIKNEIVTLRENLTSKSKNWVGKSLSHILALITKQGIPLLKEVFSEAKKLAIKEGVKHLFDQGASFIN